MNLELLSPSDPRLNQKSSRVSLRDLKSGKHDDLINSMFKLARGEQADREGKILVGLAAPQVGHMIQIILVDLLADGKGKTGNLQAFINPEIIWKSPETSEWYEGCYSAGNITGIVARPNSIRVRSYNRDGQKFEETFTGYTGRIFQHERDHLLGIRFADLVFNANNLHIVNPDDWTVYRDAEGWRNWPSKATFATWRRMKNGHD